MKKAIIFCILCSPLLALAQKDFDYSLVFTKCTVYHIVGVNKIDTSAKDIDYKMIKAGMSMTVYAGGGPIEALKPLIYRGLNRLGQLVYFSGVKDIQVSPLEPFLRISDGDKISVYQ